MHYQYFDPALIELRREITHHPDLQVILVAQESTDIYIHICEIAAYCGIVLDGTYTQEDVLELCTKMTEKLIAKRTLVINSQSLH
jgi:hypothetical protein